MRCQINPTSGSKRGRRGCPLPGAAPGGTLFLSKDGGDTWKSFDAIPFAQTHRVHFDPNDPKVIYVTTFGGSVWKGPAEP